MQPAIIDNCCVYNCPVKSYISNSFCFMWRLWKWGKVTDTALSYIEPVTKPITARINTELIFRRCKYDPNKPFLDKDAEKRFFDSLSDYTFSNPNTFHSDSFLVLRLTYEQIIRDIYKRGDSEEIEKAKRELIPTYIDMVNGNL